MRKLALILLAILAAPFLHADPPMPLSSVKTFMYQLQNIEDSDSLNALAQSPYDMLVVEPTGTLRGYRDFDMKATVARLRAAKPGRIVLAYLSIGEAEQYRKYWDKDTWRHPTKKVKAKGTPDFLLIPDPDGWSGDYPVAYWDPRWQAIIASGPDSQVKILMEAGFDGVYLDWVDAWDDDAITAEAKRQNVDPAKSMVDFLMLIRTTARQINPNALVVQQNAFGLIDADPRLKDAIDAMGVEDTWFSGKANAKWGSKGAGDVPNKETDDSSTAARLKQYQKFIAVGKPVFTVDYCVNPANAARVYKEALANHLIPLVTQVSLDHLTTTPPPEPPAK